MFKLFRLFNVSESYITIKLGEEFVIRVWSPGIAEQCGAKKSLKWLVLSIKFVWPYIRSGGKAGDFSNKEKTLGLLKKHFDSI